MYDPDDLELESSFRCTYHASRSEARWLMEILGPLYMDWWITDILRVVKAGKEATVYVCEAHPSRGLDLIAAKVYRPTAFRAMKNDAIYREGREMLDDRGHVVSDRRLERALQKQTRIGKATQINSWIEHEFQNLTVLHDAGAQVPEPYLHTGNAVLMEYIGDRDFPAPVLQGVELERAEAADILARLLNDVELMLSCNRIHADLSAFNVLYWHGDVKIIDLPQAVDARYNPSALSLLQRDLERLGSYFRRQGIELDATSTALDLWERFVATDRGHAAW
ncbi:MAG: hypothetical protein GX657_09080 [Chloroflexi bacterium]|nr:hypothetical protein [Chloroflexota bacterium]